MDAAEDQRSVDQSNGKADELPSAFSYRLVLYAVLSVTGAFILVMALFAWLDVFNENNAANVTAALSSLFGIVGTLVGAYFGIKASSDAQDRSAETAQQAVTHQKDTAQQAVRDQKETAHEAVTLQKDTAQQALTDQKETAMAAASQRSPEASRSGPMKVALASLIPIAGGAGLLVLRHYLGSPR